MTNSSQIKQVQTDIGLIAQQPHKSSLVKDLVVWLGLVVFTLISFILGQNQAISTEQATAIIILVSFVKIRLVIRYFMEVKYAPLLLKLAMDVWCLAVCGLLIFLLLFSF